MIIHETKLAKNTPIPTQLAFLEAAHQRGLLNTTKEIRLYRNLATGYQGEQFVLDSLAKYGNSSWIVLPNLWQDYYGIYESDIILITYCAIYVFEVKNFAGLFEYKNNRCYINSRRIKENYIHQAEKSFINMTHIIQGIDSRMLVKGAILFVGEHSEVNIASEVVDISIVTRSNLRHYILQIVQEDQSHLGFPIDSTKVISALENNEVLSPFVPNESYGESDLNTGHKGIYCTNCKSYKITHSKKFIHCPCKHTELRKNAVLRMIDEYQILTFNNQYIYRRKLGNFLENQVSYTFLVDILNNHFKLVYKGRHSKYKRRKQSLN